MILLYSFLSVLLQDIAFQETASSASKGGGGFLTVAAVVAVVLFLLVVVFFFVTSMKDKKNGNGVSAPAQPAVPPVPPQNRQSPSQGRQGAAKLIARYRDSDTSIEEKKRIARILMGMGVDFAGAILEPSGWEDGSMSDAERAAAERVDITDEDVEVLEAVYAEQDRQVDIHRKVFYDSAPEAYPGYGQLVLSHMQSMEDLAGYLAFAFRNRKIAPEYLQLCKDMFGFDIPGYRAAIPASIQSENAVRKLHRQYDGKSAEDMSRILEEKVVDGSARVVPDDLTEEVDTTGDDVETAPDE